jgi:hypothetical protein
VESQPRALRGGEEREADDFDFYERLEELNEELEVLNAEARELEERIAENACLERREDAGMALKLL